MPTSIDFSDPSLNENHLGVLLKSGGEPRDSEFLTSPKWGGSFSWSKAMFLGSIIKKKKKKNPCSIFLAVLRPFLSFNDEEHSEDCLNMG